ncbi:hypothetical protein TRVL_08017 [Trypanosoma vivax]|nr:hypothetical protein TRVL_08017 [Trypanosoma vivax]
MHHAAYGDGEQGTSNKNHGMQHVRGGRCLRYVARYRPAQHTRLPQTMARDKKRKEQTQIQKQTLSKRRGGTWETLDTTVHSYATALRAFSLTQHCSFTPLVCCKVSAGQTHICSNNKIKPNQLSREPSIYPLNFAVRQKCLH